MPEIDDDVVVTIYANNLKLNTSLEKSTITIEDVKLTDEQAAVVGYLINNPRNMLDVEFRLTGRTPID